MTAAAPTLVRRAALAASSLALVTLAVLAGAAWSLGSRVWPPGETSVARRLGTDPAALEAALATGDPAAELRIGIVGDVQNGITELGDLLDSFRGERIDFFLQLGDAANAGEPARYAVLRHVFQTRAPGVPVIAVPGNHDIEPDGTRTVWEQWVGPPQWRIDARGWRILGLDDAAAVISPASVEILRRAAADGPPRNGTILVAHRPLGAAEAKDGVEARARKIAATGVVPTLTISGHWHRNDQFADARGTIHLLLGENCDRASAGGDRPVSQAVLTLRGAGRGDGSLHEMRIGGIPRRVTLPGEFLRLAVGGFYPAVREHPGLLWCGIAAALAAAFFAGRAALRRGEPAPS